MRIRDAIFERLNEIRERIAEGIHDKDWSAVGWNIALVLAVVMVAAALAVGALALVGKILSTLLGKVFAVPLILLIIGLVYDNFLSGSRKERIAERTAEALNRWAEQVYYYVRDSMYYVFRAVARRMEIQMPDDPSDIEMKNRFICQGKYVVFQFYVKLHGTADKAKFEHKLTDMIAQMHRDGRFLGISEDLVNVNGRPYCPLQVLNVDEYDDGFVVQIVFADEETIPLVERAQESQRKTPGKTLYDDES